MNTVISVLQPQSSTGRLVGVGIGLWFAAALIVALSGVTENNPLATPVAIALPLIVFASLWFRAPAFRDWALSLDQGLLVLLHTGRMLGLGFVMLWFYGALPWQFALPAGLRCEVEFQDAEPASGVLANSKD